VTDTSDAPPPLVRHLESHLGAIVNGNIFEEPRVQVVRFEDRPFKGAVTYSTLGVSNHVLPQASGSSIRQELILSCHSRFNGWRPGRLLAVVAQDVLREHKALERGQVLGPAGPIREGSTAHGFYCAPPTCLPDSFAEFGDSRPATVFVWLVPITHAEFHFVWERGWSAFEDLLVTMDPDLWDLTRPSAAPEPNDVR